MRRKDSRLRTALSVLGLLALLTLTYRSVLSGHLLAGRDVFRIFFPDSAFLLESLRAGEVPLWNPYLRLGQPFAATLYSQAFYPPRWLALLAAGPVASMTVLHLAHTVLAATGVFLLTRRLNASWPAALVAGATFGLSPLMVGLGIQQNVVDAAAWSGLLLCAAYDVRHQPGRRPWLRLALCGAMSLLAGSPETTLWQGLIAMAVAGMGAPRLPRSATTPRPPRWQALRPRGLAMVRVAAAFGGAVVLTAVALLPAAEFARHSMRLQSDWAEQLTWSMSWPQVLSVFWPLADSPRDAYWGQDQWFIITLFMGTLPCVLAGLGALWGPRRIEPFALGALFLVLLSLGRHFPPAAWLLQSIPPFTFFRYPAKYFVGAAFCLAVLAAFGVDVLGRLARKRRPSGLLAAVTLTGTVLAAATIGWGVRQLPMRASAEAGAPWVPFWLGLALVLLALLPGTRGTRPGRVRAGLASLVILELVAAQVLLGQPRYTPSESLARPSALRPLLPEVFEGRISVDIEGPEDPTRTQSKDGIERSLDRLTPNRFVEARLPALEGYGAPEPRYTARFHHAGERSVYDLAGVTHYVRRGPPPFEDLELLHRAEDGTTLSRSRTALPRAFLVQQARLASDEEALEAVIDADQPFRNIAYLATGEPLDRPRCMGRVETRSRGAQHLELAVEACDDSYLIVSDSHYPGWHATVDGQEVPLHRANVSLRAVRVSQGPHTVRFEYRPLSFRVGLALSLAGWLGLAAVALRRDRRGAR
ncbi:YfhO family protein [Corallococcus macrosporus]|uniref:YfhO family protein n=1 Tax=Myxococcus fulvus (strain ATCC BAA-855 / HW-1) TaxID=483219 RepID=F8CF06_MYXFH|nr:YfhO family protein [Corallococcus macrosporus]AEI68594.1 hypothetical protein LILAB_33565 [Corallococcus macrosporus]